MPRRSAKRPSMRVKAVKSEEQQSTLAIHRVRETLAAQKLINATVFRHVALPCQMRRPSVSSR